VDRAGTEKKKEIGEGKWKKGEERRRVRQREKEGPRLRMKTGSSKREEERGRERKREKEGKEEDTSPVPPGQLTG